MENTVRQPSKTPHEDRGDNKPLIYLRNLADILESDSDEEVNSPLIKQSDSTTERSSKMKPEVPLIKNHPPLESSNANTAHSTVSKNATLGKPRPVARKSVGIKIVGNYSESGRPQRPIVKRELPPNDEVHSAQPRQPPKLAVSHQDQRTSRAPKLTPEELKSRRRDLDDLLRRILGLDLPTFSTWAKNMGLLKFELSSGPPSDIIATATGERLLSALYTKNPTSIYRHSIFTGEDISIIMKLIYHWIVETPHHLVIRWVKVNEKKLRSFYSCIRAVCTAALHEHFPLLGGPGKAVQIGFITVESRLRNSQGVNQQPLKLEIMGVLDKEAGLIRLKEVTVLDVQLAAKDAQTRDGIRSFQVLLPLIQWVDKRSILVVDEKINSNLLRELGFKHIRIAMDQGHGSDSNTDVKSYLESVRQMFQDNLYVLDRSYVQQLLDELCWREKYSRIDPFMAMMAHLKMVTQSAANTEGVVKYLAKISEDPFADWSQTKQASRHPARMFPVAFNNRPGFRECLRHYRSFPPQAFVNVEPIKQPVSVGNSAKPNHRLLNRPPNRETERLTQKRKQTAAGPTSSSAKGPRLATYQATGQVNQGEIRFQGTHQTAIEATVNSSEGAQQSGHFTEMTSSEGFWQSILNGEVSTANHGFPRGNGVLSLDNSFELKECLICPCSFLTKKPCEMANHLLSCSEEFARFQSGTGAED